MHVGNLRSALFGYLFARHSGGRFILRIEDTDRERLVPEALDYIKQNLAWLGLDPDEGPDNPDPNYGPYIQSERLEQFQQCAGQLVQEGKAYRDYTSADALAELRQKAQAAKQPFRFTKEMARLEPSSPDDPYVIRFQIQPGGDVVWQDAVWGEQRWQRTVLDDFVAIKSDGFPTYNFAVVVDDHFMDITHVFRGSEFLATTPKNILVYEAFGWDLPTYVHLPPVLGPDKAKLSKRHGAKSTLEYRDDGYLPEAVFNYLAGLGFNDGTTQEIYSREELVRVFSLDRIQSSPAVFDSERLEWMDGMFIRQMNTQVLLQRSEGFWPAAAKEATSDYKQQVLGLVQERLKFLGELPELTDFFFTDPELDQSALIKQFGPDKTQDLLLKVINTLEDSQFSEQDLEQRLRALVEQENVKTGQLFGVIRLTITGKTAAPGLFETLHVLGKEVSLRRLQQSADSL
jgi:glutamyl-tRNA synthetase